MAVATTVATRTRQSRHLSGHVIFYVVLVLGALLFLGPMLWALLSSFKPEDEFYTTFWPAHFSSSAYTSSFAAVPYLAHAFFNSALDYGAITPCSLVFTSMAGDAPARLSFIGRSGLLNLVLFTMILPAMLTLVRIYILVAHMLGW